MTLNDLSDGEAGVLECGCQIRRITAGAHEFVRIEMPTVKCALHRDYAGVCRSEDGTTQMRDGFIEVLGDSFG